MPSSVISIYTYSKIYIFRKSKQHSFAISSRREHFHTLGECFFFFSQDPKVIWYRGRWIRWVVKLNHGFFFMDPKWNDDYRVTWSISYVPQKLTFKTASKGGPADFKQWQPSKGIFVVKVTSFLLFQKSSIYLFSELQRPFIFTAESRK